jgi:hypothetical protein
LGSEPGIDNNIVTATFSGNPHLPATFVASANIATDVAETQISGVVLDNTDAPIGGVWVWVSGTTIETYTDDQGQFVIKPAPVGSVRLVVDGSSTQLPGTWPHLSYDLITIPGQNNTVGLPIHLLPLDTADGLFVDETHGGTLTLPEMPGFSLTILPGSATFPNGGRKDGVVTVTLVHADKMPMPANFGQQPRFVVTIQPTGTIFDPPAPITMPNADGFAPGQKVEMYSFDHDLVSFVSIGTGTVSQDGTMIASDPGVGVLKGGWHCGGNPNTTGGAGHCSECARCDGSQCVADPNADGKICGDNQCRRCQGGACLITPEGPSCGANTAVTPSTPLEPEPGAAARTNNFATTVPDFANIQVPTSVCLSGSVYHVRVSAITLPFFRDYDWAAVTARGLIDCDTVTPSRLNYCVLVHDLHAYAPDHTFCLSHNALEAHENEHLSYRLQQYEALDVEGQLEALILAASDQVCTEAQATTQLQPQIDSILANNLETFKTRFSDTRDVSETLAFIAEDQYAEIRRTQICTMAIAAGTDGDIHPWQDTDPCAQCSP